MQDLPTSKVFDDSANTNARVFLGPDLYLHLDGPSALVSTGPSERVAIKRESELKLPDGTGLFDGKLFYIDWLVSDANGTYMAIDLADITPNNGLGAYSIGVRYDDAETLLYGTLTDENGKVYEFKFDPENTEGVNSRQFMRGPALDPGTRQVTFTGGNALIYELAGPVTILVDTYQNAKLREGVIFPKAEASANGIKVGVPYGYFGDDFTGLWVEIDTSAYGALPRGGSLRIRPNSALMGRAGQGGLNFENTAIKDKWNVYNLTHSLVSNRLYQPGEQIPVHILSQLNRATAQTLRINGFTIDMELPPDLAPEPQAVITLPIAELSETETKKAVGYLVEYEGYQAEIVSVRALRNQSEWGEYVLLVLEHKPAASPANIRLNGFHFKIRNGMGDKDSYTYKTKDFGASHHLLPRQSHIRFKYDPNQTEIKLEVSGLNYDLINPMEITIPAS